MSVLWFAVKTTDGSFRLLLEGHRRGSALAALPLR